MYLTVRITDQSTYERGGIVIEEIGDNRIWFEPLGFGGYIGWLGHGTWEYDWSYRYIRLYEEVRIRRLETLILGQIPGRLTSFSGGETGTGQLLRSSHPDMQGQVEWRVLGAYPGPCTLDRATRRSP